MEALWSFSYIPIFYYLFILLHFQYLINKRPSPELTIELAFSNLWHFTHFFPLIFNWENILPSCLFLHLFFYYDEKRGPLKINITWTPSISEEWRSGSAKSGDTVSVLFLIKPLSQAHSLAVPRELDLKQCKYN
jgi:hypothetical protein